MTPMTNENTLKKQALGSVIFVVILLTVAFLIFKPEPEGPGSLDAFAQCLTEKGWTMYGAYWCPHCQNEKKAFGSSWKYVDSVECTDEPQRCTDAGVTGFPTWLGPESARLEGEQGIAGLSEASSCT